MPNNEFGDFQTPLDLARQCLRLIGVLADARILEPTCGRGSFLQASAEVSPASERVGIEIQPEHADIASKFGTVLQSNIFRMNLATAVTWQSSGDLLIVGNPPWVTSAELNRMDSNNLPDKANFKGAKGLDALLGSSNFDVCEFIILKLLSEFQQEQFVLAMLCKTQVARNVIEYAASIQLPIADAALHRIDAMTWFGAAVDACWFIVRSDASRVPDYSVAVHSELTADTPNPQRFGVVGGRLVSNVDLYEQVRDADGQCPFEWRSGLKHDASAVFELTASPEPTTRDGVRVDIEDDYLLPFLKSTDLFRGRHRDHSKWVIVPQKSFGADTSQLQFLAPRLWDYLNSHTTVLNGRKSSIYRNRPRFSVFGHGEYTFAPYKVAISGLHKKPEFRLVGPIAGQPVVLDDTCYFLPFTNATEAAIIWAVLSSRPSIALIESLVFWDAKRPITKKLLARLNLNKLPIDYDAVTASAEVEATQAGIEFDCGAAELVSKQLQAEVGGVLF